ncbi:hypothetical protein F2Q68_00026205 [Brassica cretica]|uniref:Uncharacterized protein n=1 Tax=Brassica cretica TaxID=69181 RepID=A0A8S9IH62_BRACR|nr:hypothetical protein F2Q68_00026205 [Brassica cretica]
MRCFVDYEVGQQSLKSEYMDKDPSRKQAQEVRMDGRKRRGNGLKKEEKKARESSPFKD